MIFRFRSTAWLVAAYAAVATGCSFVAGGSGIGLSLDSSGGGAEDSRQAAETSTPAPAQPAGPVRTVTLPDSLAKPFVVDGSLSAAALEPRSDFAEQPDFFLETSGPLAQASILSVTPGLAIGVLGPINEGTSLRAPSDGQRGDAGVQLGKVAMGRFAVWIKRMDRAQAKTFRLVITDAKTVLDPLARFTDVDPARPVTARGLGQHYPFLDQRRTDAETAEVHKRLFLESAADLFVFAVTDIGRELLVFEGPKSEPPRAGEPLLVRGAGLGGDGTGVTVLTSDGLSYTVPQQLLAPRPKAGVAVPKEPRVAVQPADMTMRLTTDEDAPLLAAQKQLDEQVRACATPIWEKHDKTGHARDYDLVTYDKDGNVLSTENWGEKIDAMIRKQCPVEKAEKARVEMLAKLNENRRQRQIRSLQAIEQRLQTLFGTGG